MREIDLTGIDTLCQLKSFLEELIPNSEMRRAISDEDYDYLHEEIKNKFGAGGLNVLQESEMEAELTFS